MKPLDLGASAVILGAIFIGYLFYTPIPTDLASPWHFRLLVAGLKTGDIMTALTLYLRPSDPHLHVRAMRTLTEAGLPEPDVQPLGSNLTARFDYFDGIRVLIYEPLHRPDTPIPALIYFHGGGYALGSAKLHGAMTRYLAERLNMVLISVEYRLAPEHPLPAGPDDGITATKYFLHHASEFGVDPHRVVVAGDSAGGHLTAVVAQHIYDDPSVPDLKLQVHFYPWLQALDLCTPSYQLYENTYGELGLSRSKVIGFMAYNYIQRLDADFERKFGRNMHMSTEFKRSHQFLRVFNHDIIHDKLANASFLQQMTEDEPFYSFNSLSESLPNPALVTSSLSSSSSSSSSWFLSSLISPPISYQTPDFTYEPQEAFEPGNETFWSELQDYYLNLKVTPLLREDMRGLPKAFIATTDQDVLRDDGIFYAHALEQGGVAVSWKNYKGAWHGIAGMGILKDIPVGVEMIEDAISFIQDNI